MMYRSSSFARSRWMLVWLLVSAATLGARPVIAQELGSAGTVQGVVKDSSGGVMVAVTVNLSNPVSGFTRDATTDSAGKFVFRNLAPNTYHLVIVVDAFQKLSRDVDVRNSLPIDLGTLTLALANATTSVEVKAQGSNLVERDTTAHTDVDQALVAKLALEPTSGLNQSITLASPGVVADSNGFFHPVGDHAQTQFSIDNQPVTDQQSRVYSNQISPDAVQSMEVMTGVAPAEFGDKSSLIVRIVTKSGLDQKPNGNVTFGFGSFKTPTAEANLAAGTSTVGNFLSVSGLSTDRYLDPPEFTAIHDHGDSQSLFDRLDARTSANGTFHLNVQEANSSFDVPNTYDQDASGQAQHQTIKSFNAAPGYSAVIGTHAVLAANGFVRQDRVVYSPSANPFADTPATMSQNRRLTNVGGKVDFSYVAGHNNIKIGGSATATLLSEQFSLGLTDPTFNSPCVDANGDPSAATNLTTPSQCTGALSANSAFLPGLAPYDLSRGGTRFNFNDTGTIKQQAAYVQDEITAGQATFNLGVRFDHYVGLTTASAAEPRAGVAYQIKRSSTVFRASYGQTMETPYNENLLLSSATGTNGLAGSVFGANSEQPLQVGRRREFETGVQQGFGHWIVVDVGYFQKYTKNGYDFDVLFNTPIVFPISWDHSQLSGITGRVNLVEHRGFSAFTVFGHSASRFFNPENGGILFDSPLPTGVFRIDHDQKFQQTTNLQYVFDKAHGVWGVLTWRFDSGLVDGSVPDYASALALDADQQAAIGLFCGNTFATLTAPITSCNSTTRGATRVVILPDGTENDDTNPPRIAARNLLDLGVGADNLFGGKKTKIKVRISVINVTNKDALYNFLSTFSGTHFVTPRTLQVQFGIAF